jgi:hypothetical protein
MRVCFGFAATAEHLLRANNCTTPRRSKQHDRIRFFPCIAICVCAWVRAWVLCRGQTMTNVTIPKEVVQQALTKAYRLGQVYWQQADSEYSSQHRKSTETAEKFKLLCRETDEALRAAMSESLDSWLSMATAPKDTDVLLNIPKRGAIRGRWEADKYAKNPRSYWTNDQVRLWGVAETRSSQPTGWMPLPAPPKDTPAQGEAV